MKVLIIDDEPLVRRSLERAFLGQGHKVYVAADGHEGLAVWEKQNPDLVFLDILMPGMTGPQVLQAIKPELRSRTKVITMSAYTGNNQIETSQAPSADRFLAKPFEDIFVIVKLAEEMMKEQL